MSLYEKYINGRISGFLTRIPLCLIKEGQYVPSRGFEYCCDQPPEDVVIQFMHEIRGGARPTLHLYGNLNPADNARFMCSDDVAACIAYRQLDFGAAPAVVLGAGKESLPFSAFETRSNGKDLDYGPGIRGIISTGELSLVSSVAGPDLPEGPGELLGMLQKKLTLLVAKLRAFHLAGPDEIHYHHMVFSALVRMQETLRAIYVLVEQDLWYQALSLLRVVYEIHLNFYFDWVQPETSYRYLAAAAVFNGKEVSRRREDMRSRLESDGVPSTVATERAGSVWKPVLMASNISEKAKLSKIGIIFHKNIYEFLSGVTHQDFEVASIHANRFNDEDYLVVDASVKKTYLRFMDYVVAEFVACIDDDIGRGEGLISM